MLANKLKILFFIFIILIIFLVLERPRLGGSRASDKSYALTAMKSGYFTAQYVFKNKCIKDKNGNGIGEFGTISELVEHGLLNDSVKGYTQGYRYSIFLPANPGDSEKRFTIVAYPRDSINPILAMDQDKLIYRSPSSEMPLVEPDLSTWIHSENELELLRPSSNGR